MTKVICGFPGVGKSTLFNSGIKCTDSDSSKFDKDLFPGNYVDHIQALLDKGEVDYIFVSTHAVVRRELMKRGIPYTLVYPNIQLKEEYLERYRERGSPEAFISLMDKSWTTFVIECAEQVLCKRVVLQSGEYLSDVLEVL